MQFLITPVKTYWSNWISKRDDASQVKRIYHSIQENLIRSHIPKEKRTHSFNYNFSSMIHLFYIYILYFIY